MNCDPNALIEAAKCLDCLSSSDLLDIETLLYCGWIETTGCLPPPPPESLIGFGGNLFVDISWFSNTDPALDFVFYYGVTPGGPYPSSVSIPSTDRSATIGLAAGSYCGVIVARDTVACTSSYSNETCFAVTTVAGSFRIVDTGDFRSTDTGDLRIVS